MIGKQILHYKVIEKLGEGGMGVVYLAEDSKLNRKVAIKFLPRHISADAEQRKRFKIEARAAASLNHPNIATIHYIEEVDDETFIVMEYIDGVELREKIKSGPLPLNEAVTIAKKIAEGLQAAHEQDIVHRDIKSGNIMLTNKGLVKVMDFGLAKVRGVVNVTKEGTTLGTITYMSPEQASGSEVDRRSDIWSLGVILYEMVAGKLPFQGTYDQAVVYAIMNDKPQQLRLIRKDVPAELESIISRALEKNPRNRYQKVDEMIADLKNIQQNSESVTPGTKSMKAKPAGKEFLRRQTPYWIAVIIFITTLVIIKLPITEKADSPAMNKKSVAVMPFKNLSNDAANDYFSEGITEDIIAQLSKISEIKVIARSSVDRLIDQGMSINEIAGRLKVASILEGSVRRGGDRVRIVSRLINVENMENIWAETYDRDLEDIFQIQTDVSRQIAAALQAKLSPVEKEQLQKKPTENLEAYKLYLQGRFHWRRRNADELMKAAANFERAVELDSLFALAYVGLADCYALFPYYGVQKFAPAAAFDRAEKMAYRALELEPDLAAAHTSLGNALKEGKWDWKSAEEEFQKAIMLNPKDANAYQWYSELLLILDRQEEALDMAQTAYNLEPYSQVISNNLGRTLLFMKRYDAAKDQLLKTIELDSLFSASHNNLAWAFLLSGQLDEAKKEFHYLGEMTKIEAFFVDVLTDPGNVRAREQLEEILANAKLATSRYSNVSQAPIVYAMMNEKQKAIEWLTILYNWRSPSFIYHLGHPALDVLKDEPEFVRLYDKIGLNLKEGI